MWLEDHEIETLIQQASPDSLTRALQAIAFRVECETPPAIAPLEASSFSVFHEKIPNDVLFTLLEWTLKTHEPNTKQTLEQIALLVLHHASEGNMFHIAHRLMIAQRAQEDIRTTLLLIHQGFSLQWPLSRVKAVSNFFATLLDGKPPVIQTVLATLSTWGKSPAEVAILQALAPALSPEERAQLPLPHKS